MSFLWIVLRVATVAALAVFTWTVVFPAIGRFVGVGGPVERACDRLANWIDPNR